MTQFMRAHGYAPGPTQRPVLTGTICGLLALLPAVTLAWFTGGLPSLADTMHIPAWLVVAIEVVVLAAAGAIYGRILMRAANDRHGGWLFGLCYGFLIWLLGPVTLLQWIVRRPVASGGAAIGLVLAYLVYGLVLGSLVPRADKLLQRKSGGPLRPPPQASPESGHAR